MATINQPTGTPYFKRPPTEKQPSTQWSYKNMLQKFRAKKTEQQSYTEEELQNRYIYKRQEDIQRERDQHDRENGVRKPRELTPEQKERKRLEKIRKNLLWDTIDEFKSVGKNHFRQVAQENLERWAKTATEVKDPIYRLDDKDWGDSALDLTREFGETFAVLNMASPYVPGGGYKKGTAAQEENMFRRTDCHFTITDKTVMEDPEVDWKRFIYKPEIEALVTAKDGKVLLDVANPRTCIRGSEDSTAEDLGYRWLNKDEIFPFYEMRSAAIDFRPKKTFSEKKGRTITKHKRFSREGTRKRIVAQLETAIEKNIRYLLLGAFGCGAFRGDGDQIAELYCEEIMKRDGQFDVVVFSVFYPGYGPDNYSKFKVGLKPLLKLKYKRWKEQRQAAKAKAEKAKTGEAKTEEASETVTEAPTKTEETPETPTKAE